MSKHYWLFMLVTALSWFNTGVVWLIQFSCYPLWRLVGQEEFLTYHNVWWRARGGSFSCPVCCWPQGQS